MAESEEGRERLNRLAYEARVLQGQGQELQAQMEALRATAMQAREAIESLKGLEGEAGEGNARDGFVPVGAGVFAPAEIREGNVVVEVGAGVLVEKTRSEAAAILEKRLKDVADAQARMQAGATRLNARMHEIDSEARGLVSGMREGGEGPG
ncbi:MAG: prefoldin subunit alpha [Candidatus ainarchaeum sp.]|nr:prefoldin subunit alpha [Candidatus ainarchaeum sp.]